MHLNIVSMSSGHEAKQVHLYVVFQQKDIKTHRQLNMFKLIIPNKKKGK